MRNISSNGLAKLATQYGIEPINIVEIDWFNSSYTVAPDGEIIPNGTPSTATYADRYLPGPPAIPGKIVNIGALDEVVDMVLTNGYAQPSSGFWHHLAVIYDKTQAGSNAVNLYIDGVLQTATSRPYTSTNTNSFGTNPLYLFSQGGSQLFNAAEVDDLRLYNVALSASQVEQILSIGDCFAGVDRGDTGDAVDCERRSTTVHGDRNL